MKRNKPQRPRGSSGGDDDEKNRGESVFRRRRHAIPVRKQTYVIRIHDPATTRQLEFIKSLRFQIGREEYDAVYCFPERDIRRLTRGQAADLIKLLLERKNRIDDLLQW